MSLSEPEAEPEAQSLPEEVVEPEPKNLSEDPPAALGRLRSGVELVSVIAAPSSIFTGLLFYFGWVYTSARSLYFGIDPSILGFSTADYILRSFDVLQVPLGALLLLVLVLVRSHSRLSSWARKRQSETALMRVRLAITATGALLFVIGLSGLTSRPIAGSIFLATHLGLCFGAGLLAYAGYLRRRFPEPGGTSSASHRTNLLSAVLVGLFMTMTLFLAVGQWADAAGRGAAQRLEATLDTARPSVSLYSERNLHIDGPGVVAIGYADPEAAYRFKYAGLTLLIRSGGKYFLLPTQWSRNSPVAFVVDESDSVRMEFTPGALTVQPK